MCAADELIHNAVRGGNKGLQLDCASCVSIDSDCSACERKYIFDNRNFSSVVLI